MPDTATNDTPLNFPSSQDAEETQSTSDILQLSSDPFLWNLNEQTRDFINNNGIPRDNVTYFTNSRKVYNDKTRFCSESLFQRTS